MPFSRSASLRAPARTQTPTAADSSPGMASVTMRNPLERVVRLTVNARSVP